MFDQILGHHGLARLVHNMSQCTLLPIFLQYLSIQRSDTGERAGAGGGSLESQHRAEVESRNLQSRSKAQRSPSHSYPFPIPLSPGPETHPRPLPALYLGGRPASLSSKTSLAIPPSKMDPLSSATATFLSSVHSLTSLHSANCSLPAAPGLCPAQGAPTKCYSQCSFLIEFDCAQLLAPSPHYFSSLKRIFLPGIPRLRAAQTALHLGVAASPPSSYLCPPFPLPLFPCSQTGPSALFKPASPSQGPNLCSVL